MALDRLYKDLETELLHVARALRRRLIPLRGVLRVADAYGIRAGELAAGTLRDALGVLQRMPMESLPRLARAASHGDAGPDAVDALAAALIEAPIHGPKLLALERAAVAQALVLANGNASAAARSLNMDRKAFMRRLRPKTTKRRSRA